MSLEKPTLGVIVGNRGFFPDHLCETGRADILRVLKEEGIEVVIVGTEDTAFEPAQGQIIALRYIAGDPRIVIVERVQSRDAHRAALRLVA